MPQIDPMAPYKPPSRLLLVFIGLAAAAALIMGAVVVYTSLSTQSAIEQILQQNHKDSAKTAASTSRNDVVLKKILAQLEKS